MVRSVATQVYFGGMLAKLMPARCSRALLLAAFVIAVPVSAAEDSGGTLVGVSPFRGTEYSAEQRKALTDAFQNAVLRTGTVALLEQDQLRSLVREQSLAQAGVINMETFVLAARTGGAQQMFFPTISQVGKTTTIAVKLVDVQTGATIKSASVDTRRSFDKLLRNDLQKLAELICGPARRSRSVYGFDPTQKREPVAVLDVAGHGIEKAAAVGLTNRLRDELFNTGIYDVMERQEMEALLREQGLQQTGICNEENCMVQVGQVIGVRYMLGGAVSRIGDRFSVSARLIEVETSKITRAATADVKGDVDRVLKETMNDVARAISGLKPLRRTNGPALAWLAGAAVLAGAGAYCTYGGSDAYNTYRDEQYDLDAVAQSKETSRNYYIASYLLYGASALAGALSLYVFVSGKLKLRVDQFANAGGAGTSLALEVDIGQ